MPAIGIHLVITSNERNRFIQATGKNPNSYWNICGFDLISFAEDVVPEYMRTDDKSIQELLTEKFGPELTAIVQKLIAGKERVGA